MMTKEEMIKKETSIRDRRDFLNFFSKKKSYSSEVTYESKTEHPQCTDGMEQHPDSEYLNINRADNQVIEKISRRKCLDEPPSTRIPVHPLSGVHGLAFLVKQDKP